MLATVVALAVPLLLAGCGADESAPGPTTASSSATGSPSSPASPTGSPSATPSTSPTTAPSSADAPRPSPTDQTTTDQTTTGQAPAEQTEQTGIDASHHQGPIDWRQVAGAGIEFAYLKASEGTRFVDPRFAENRRAATARGLVVGGYHYFQLCTDGTAQARHFIDVLGKHDPVRQLAPALDLELAGSCATPPPRAELLAEVREFLAVVDAHTGTRTVVYLYPELEERFGFAGDLADHPQWVRRLGDREPRRPWQVWQYDDRGTVPGIAGGVDLNLRRTG
ncbi:hypothetical protein JK386_08965 [Nocardioides sp. zg-536]|uniref:Lysozyme n=1 Tax=Nocardioides faecalis TaxID=2803858 RepID=A0A939BY68_9ACTN|nr:GH25 family lysozyme [Nocardioides faecalis]MBM9460033.1 hypothetical protein [Nocardioides faecalis]QVI58747.1 hypothetical protein KG111_17630 [Nocardioides faecalis]